MRLQGTKLGKDMLVGWEESIVPKYYVVKKRRLGTRDLCCEHSFDNLLYGGGGALRQIAE